MPKTIDQTIFKEWLDLAEAFAGCVNKALAEIHQKKQEVESIKTAFLEELHSGQFISDPECIIISAPKIIIGNVNKSGELKSGGGEVIIRGTNLKMNGVSEAGRIEMAAPTICQTAIDTGIDGREKVVYIGSTITSQARSITLDSKNPNITATQKDGVFMTPPPTPVGISLLSETGIDIGATLSKKAKADIIKDYKETLTNKKGDDTQGVQGAAKVLEGQLTALVGEMNNTLKQEDKMIGDDDLTRTNVMAIDELNSVLKEKMPLFYNTMIAYVEKNSELAELNRALKCVAEEEKAPGQTVKEDEFPKKSTGTSIILKSENIALHSVDGDSNWRTNPESGIDIRANDIKLRSLAEKDALSKPEDKSRITLQSRNIDLLTSDQKDIVYDGNEVKSKKMPLEGSVSIRSKTVNIDSIDIEQTDKNQFKEKLNADSEVNIRAQKVRVNTINENGKSVGKFSVHSKKISMKSVDVNDNQGKLEFDEQKNVKHPKLTAQEVTKESQMTLLSAIVNVGYSKKKMMSDRIYVLSKEKSVVHSDKQTMITMGADQKGSAGVDLKSDNVSLIASNGKAFIKGKSGVLVYGETSVKAKMNAGDIACNSVDAKSYVKSPNFTDGISTPAAVEAVTDQAEEVDVKEEQEED